MRPHPPKQTDVVPQTEGRDVSGVVVRLLHRGPLAHDGQVDERGRRGPLVGTARQARQVHALHRTKLLRQPLHRLWMDFRQYHILRKKVREP